MRYFPCGWFRWNTCLHTNPSTFIDTSGERITFTSKYTCVIKCHGCHKIYIGETGRRLGDRVRKHLRSISARCNRCFFFFFFFFFLRYVARVFSSFPVAFKPLTKGEYPLGRKFEPHLIFMYLPGMFFTLLSRKARCSLNGNNLCSNSLLVLEALSLRLLHYYFYLLAFFTLFLFSIFFFAVLFVYISIRALTFIQDVLQGYRNFFVLSDSRQASFIL